MNALTKALVVVVTILAVILVALVIPFAATVPDYAQQYRDKDAELKTQLAAASEDAANARRDIAAKGEEATGYLAEIQKLSGELAAVKSDRTALEAELAQSETVIAGLTSAMEVTARTGETKDKEIATANGLIQKQISMLGDLQSQIADLTQSLISVRADNRRLGDNYLRIQEENKALVTRLSEAVSQFDELVKVAKAQGIDLTLANAPVVPDDEIRGSVVKIDQVTDGLTFVQLNVGTRDLVKEGMEFTVSRGDEFVGTVKIASVDTAECVGRLTLGGGIKEGDAVRAGGR